VEILALSIGIGLVVGLICSEAFGMASAGLIVPGYLALYLTRPAMVVATLAVAFATFGVVRIVASFLIVHGRRRTALMILIGYILGMLVTGRSGLGLDEVSTIGFIIPGLIAVWLDRQGIPQTLSALMVVTVAVRLVLVLAGAEIEL
jgi:poly-gamma-glutamate biosynthesis protein PgsC/CapC